VQAKGFMAVLSNRYLTKNLPNLTLPDSFSIPYPKPAGGSPIPALHPGGQLINFLKNILVARLLISK